VFVCGVIHHVYTAYTLRSVGLGAEELGGMGGVVRKRRGPTTSGNSEGGNRGCGGNGCGFGRATAMLRVRMFGVGFSCSFAPLASPHRGAHRRNSDHSAASARE
jgi:hypothetical protein